MNVILTVDAITRPITGIGRYALELARGLRGHPAVDDCRYFAAFDFVDDPDRALDANRLVASARRRVPLKTAALRLYLALRQRAFRRRARGLEDYVLHCPNFLLLDHDGPSVTTVHDLSWIHYPDFHPVERVRVLERMLPRTLARADRVIADSEFVKREIVAQFGVPEERVEAIPLGVGDAFRPRARAECLDVLRRYGLADAEYVLAVGTAEPRKNLARLVEAHARLSPALRARHPLVVVGADGWSTEAAAPAAAGAGPDATRRLGYVPEADLPQLYAAAHAFAYASLYEGFGLPPLEAMACGVPVLVSNASSLPEVVGDAALLADPSDVDALARQLARLVSDDAWRAAARERGPLQAAPFTWRRCTERTIDVYRSVARA